MVLLTASATQFGTLRCRAQCSLREVLSVDYAVPASFERGRRVWKAPMVRRPAQKASMASLRVIAALNGAYALSALCAECTLCAMRCYETPLTATATRLATDHGHLVARALRSRLPRIVESDAFGNSATAIRPCACSPEPAVFIDTQFRSVLKPAENR